MVLGKRWLFLIGNGAEIQPLKKDRKGPMKCPIIRVIVCQDHVLYFSQLKPTCIHLISILADII